MSKLINLACLTLAVSFSFGVFADEEEEKDRGGIDEITVTAEKRTSTVSETSMTITASDA